MKFKKGDKVEVMNKEDVPVSWRTAKILSGNGHTYCVQSDYRPVMGGARMEEMVSRKLVRPCPPLVQGVESCIAGDVVEVFYENSWKIAELLNNPGSKKESVSRKIHKIATIQNQYSVKLLGCSKKLIVDRSNIRMGQTWDDDKWILMGKSYGAGDDVIARYSSTSIFCQKINFQASQLNSRNKDQLKKDLKNINDDDAFRESLVISSRSLKRMSPYSSSIVEAHNMHAQKFRAIEKEGRNHRLALEKHMYFSSRMLLIKLEAPVFSRARVGCIICFQWFNDDARVCRSVIYLQRDATVNGHSLVSYNLAYLVILLHLWLNWIY